MDILIGGVIYVSTMLASNYIKSNTLRNLCLKVYDNGYKFREDVIYGDKNKDDAQRVEDMAYGYSFGKLGALFYLTPGLNILSSLFLRHCGVTKTFDELKKDGTLERMDYEQKNSYGKCKSKKEKINNICSVGIKDHELKKYKENYSKPIQISGEYINDQFNLEEVKELNKATKHSYRVGTIEDKNVCVIGIPNDEYKVTSILVGDGEDKKTYQFSQLKEEECQDKEFIVYPYSLECKQELGKSYNNILDNRKKMETLNSKLDQLLEVEMNKKSMNTNISKSNGVQLTK